MESCFKAAAIERFICSEVAAGRIILRFFGITQADPPLVTRSINALSTVALNHSSALFNDFVVVRRADQHSSALPQSIFIKEQLNLRQTR